MIGWFLGDGWRVVVVGGSDDAGMAARLTPHESLRDWTGRLAVAETTALLERADLLTLTPAEMTVLVGGMRALGANAGGSTHGVLTDRPGQLTNDFFVHLLDMATVWTPVDADAEVFEGKDRGGGELKYTGTRNDLIFGSNAILRAYAEVYASGDGRRSSSRTSSLRGPR